jgi:hypothetical protein
LLTACAGTSFEVPANVSIGGRPPALGTSADADFAAPPQIAQIWLSDQTLRRGGVWSGAVMASNNVASVEIRTDSFSFSVPRRRPGDFEFRYDIPDLPPYLQRSFVLHVIARNAAGLAQDEAIPIEIR